MFFIFLGAMYAPCRTKIKPTRYISVMSVKPLSILLSTQFTLNFSYIRFVTSEEIDFFFWMKGVFYNLLVKRFYNLV